MNLSEKEKELLYKILSAEICHIEERLKIVKYDTYEAEKQRKKLNLIKEIKNKIQ